MIDMPVGTVVAPRHIRTKLRFDMLYQLTQRIADQPFPRPASLACSQRLTHSYRDILVKAQPRTCSQPCGGGASYAVPMSVPVLISCFLEFMRLRLSTGTIFLTQPLTMASTIRTLTRRPRFRMSLPVYLVPTQYLVAVLLIVFSVCLFSAIGIAGTPFLCLCAYAVLIAKVVRGVHLAHTFNTLSIRDIAQTKRGTVNKMSLCASLPKICRHAFIPLHSHIIPYRNGDHGIQFEPVEEK